VILPGRDPAARPPRAAPAVVLTGRGAGVLGAFLALAALTVGTGSEGLFPLLVALGVVLVGAAAVAWWRGVRGGGGGVQVRLRACPPAVPVGGACSLVAEVSGPPRRGAPLGLDRPREHWQLTRRLVPAGPAGQPAGPRRRRLAGRLVAPAPPSLVPLATDAGTGALGAVWTGRRGLLRLPPLRVWTHDPFGLFAVAVATTAPVVVVVHPEPLAPPAGPPPSSAGAAATAAVARAAAGASGGWGDFSDLRPYVAGDRLNLIDWPALARYDRLLVRRFDPEEGVAVRLLLDDRPGVHRRAAFERLVATLLWLVEGAVAGGRAVEVTTISGRTFAVAASPDGLAAFLAVAATLEPQRAPGAAVAPERPGAALLTTATGAGRLAGRPPRAAVVVA